MQHTPWRAVAIRAAVSPDSGTVRAPPGPPEGPEVEASRGSEVTVRATEGADAGSPSTAASSTLARCVLLPALGPVRTSPVGLACPPGPPSPQHLGPNTTNGQIFITLLTWLLFEEHCTGISVAASELYFASLSS